jgi:hypothetical protein
MAAPHVTGTLALMLKNDPLLTQAEAETVLESSAIRMRAGCRNVRPAIGAPAAQMCRGCGRNGVQVDRCECSGGSNAVIGMLQQFDGEGPRRWRAFFISAKVFLSVRSLQGGQMLWTISITLLMLWLLGIVSANTFGGFIHVLLWAAIGVVLLGVLQGRRKVT